MQHNLTTTINHRLATLKADVNNLPSGGGLEVLRNTLVGLVDKVNGLVAEIDHINGVKTPKKAPIKTMETYYTNGLGCDPGGGA